MSNYNNDRIFETVDDRTWKEKLKWKIDRAAMHVENFAAWAVQNPYLSVPLTIVTMNFINSSLNRRQIYILEQEKNRRLEKQLKYNREVINYDRERRNQIYKNKMIYD